MVSGGQILSFIKELKNQWLLGAVVFFVLSLVMGAVEGGPYPFIYTGLWLVFGLFFFFCIFKAFPKVWHLLVLICGIYLFSFLGMIFFVRVHDLSNWGFLLLALTSEGIALWGVAVTLFTVANRRDEMVEVLRYQKKRTGKEKTDAYVPLGLWSLSVILLYFLSNISIWYWSDYQLIESLKSFVGYIVSELIFLVLLLYFFWIPENFLDYSHDKDVVTELKTKPIMSFFQRFSLTRKKEPITRITRKRLARKKILCPDCRKPLIMERRNCPGCGKMKRFGWCARSEDFIVNCPKCRNLVGISAGVCKKCGEKINDEVQCSCGERTEIGRWELIKK